MAHWIIALGQLKLVKSSKTCLLCGVTQRKLPPKSNNFFKIETRRLAEYVDCLNSSVAIVAGEL